MTTPRRFACLVTTACLLAPAAQAASGGIDSFWASATQVTTGQTVDFSVTLSLGTTSWSGGGSNPVEPAPEEGYQEWHVNWYSWEHETLRSVWLQAGSEGFADQPALGPGEGYGNTWSFSVLFTTVGTYAFDLTGGWQSEVHNGYSNESATRNCYYTDPDNSADLYCDSWSWQYSDADDWYGNEGGLWGGSISIDVVATPVPEPGSWALMLAGAGLLASHLRNRSRYRG